MNYNVPFEYQINIAKKSTIRTINNYLKAEVIEALFDCLIKGLTVDANYWAAELFASGFYLPLWDCIFKFYFQHIHMMNPNLIEYLNQKHILLSQIKKLYTNNAKNLYNNQELRNHLAEIITLLCLAEKFSHSIPSKINTLNIDNQTYVKTGQIIQIIAPYLTPQSLLYEQYQSFIINYYNDLDNCLYYIDWFIKDNQHTITHFEDLKVPIAISQKSMWLIWKFMLIQYKTLKSKHTLNGHHMDKINELLELLVNLYISIYKRKDYDACSYLLFFSLKITKSPEILNWSASIDTTQSLIIKQCAEINKVYRHLQLSYENKKNNPKSKTSKKSQKEEKSQKFYENQKIIEFLRLINDFESLQTGFGFIPQIIDSDDDSDEQEEVIPLGPESTLDEKLIDADIIS